MPGTAVFNFFPEGQPLLHDQGHAAMLTCLGDVEIILVPVPGSRAGSFMSSQDANYRCLSHGLGAILEGRSSQGLWKDHHLSWHINHLEMLAVFFALNNFLADLRGHHVLVHSDNTAVVSYINHQGVCIHFHLQTGVQNPPVVPREVVVSSSSLHPGGPQYRSRHPVETGAEARVMEAPP